MPIVDVNLAAPLDPVKPTAARPFKFRRDLSKINIGIPAVNRKAITLFQIKWEKISGRHGPDIGKVE